MNATDPEPGVDGVEAGEVLGGGENTSPVRMKQPTRF